MNKTAYKNAFNAEHYDRIVLAVPKGMKDVYKARAAEKGMTLSAYIVDCLHHDQMGMFDGMQIAERNQEQIRSLTGNMHDGYNIVFKDGHSVHCRTKKDARKAIIDYCASIGVGS